VSHVLHAAVSLFPVLVFLAALTFMDSYKLVSVRSILLTIAIGCLTAIFCLFLNRALLDLLDIAPGRFRRYDAPILEETFKAAYIVILIRARRVGFMVDSAIYGFALGAGFALVENLYYLGALSGSDFFLYLVRGFGTAILHGSTTAIFAILSKSLLDRKEGRWVFFLPPLLLAVAVHSLFNHFVVAPLVMTLTQLVLLPLLLVAVFERSEQATRHWLGVGFDTDVELLEQITTGRIADSRVGKYLESLGSTFPGIVVADMLCMMQVHLELSLRAKGILLARKAGINLPVDPAVRANLVELQYLQKSVGKTGRLAIHPFLATSSRDLWQLTMLGK
jgi:RsiW-degrading membrane proteinase PrsW (M82 family)